jgi:antitoxin MazE
MDLAMVSPAQRDLVAERPILGKTQVMGVTHFWRSLRTEALTGGQRIDIYIVDTSRNGIMKVQFLKWGNSLALRVPKVFAQEIGASVGKPATMEVRDGKLVVELAKPRRRQRRYTLEQLVAGIRPENRHSELEWGPPVGNEAW